VPLPIRFTGPEWQDACAHALEQKFGTRWQKIPDRNQGDWGLEGFVRPDGLVVQCYADEAMSNAARTTAQCDKLTRDLQKLLKYQAPLSKHLNMQVTTYAFLVPDFEDKDVIVHVTKKRLEVLGWGLPWIADDFEIVVKDRDFIALEWEALHGNVPNYLDLGIETSALADAEQAPIGNDLLSALDRKLRAIPRLQSDDTRRQEMHALLLRSYHRAGLTLRQMDVRSPSLADRVRELRVAREATLVLRSMASDGIDDITRLSSEMAAELRAERSIAPDRVNDLAMGAIAGWLLECPLEYRST